MSIICILCNLFRIQQMHVSRNSPQKCDQLWCVLVSCLSFVPQQVSYITKACVPYKTNACVVVCLLSHIGGWLRGLRARMSDRLLIVCLICLSMPQPCVITRWVRFWERAVYNASTIVLFVSTLPLAHGILLVYGVAIWAQGVFR